jgi:hypothetical protein
MTGKYRPYRIMLWLAAFAISHSVAAQVIPVSNVEELYSAVNDPGNAGATLLLAAGTYMLSVNDPDAAPRPKGGRIELQPNMSLIGLEGDRTAVVIDALNLPATSFPQIVNGVNLGPNAAVRMGLGHNRVEWLTVRNAVWGQANIDSGLQPLDPGTAFISIAHVASTGSTRGINILNFGPLASEQTIEAEITDCWLFDNDFNLSEGIRLGNFQGARRSVVNVRMSGNRSWGQKQGRLIVNNRAFESTVNVVSSGNRFYDNGGGTIIVGGLSSNNTRADSNTINFDAHGDQFLSNTGDTELDRGGLIALGVENVSPSAGGGSNNTVRIRLWGCRMADNGEPDLTAIGARSVPEATASLSQNNHVVIEIRGEGSHHGRWEPVEYFADQVPANPNYGNSVSIVR